MNRNNIRGFTISLFNKMFEFVFIGPLLKTIAIYKKNNIDLIKRLEF